ncbi:hypothetical protein H2203_005252 [Taxawa tesnikishii (nom. ined.)]|nr:hypothetical protein H2203_005252 [Dothideales sp. JES 119]
MPDYAFDTSINTDQSADQALWSKAMSTLERAKACFVDNEPEAPWLAIAAKLLEDVFAQSELDGMLCVKDVQYSDINSNSLLPHVHNTAIPTKKADLAIAVSAHTPATAPVYTALRTSDPTMRLSQMSETSVSRLALPGCIEVGEPGKSYLEASLQLGVWCFAGLEKLKELRVHSGKTDEQILASGEEKESEIAQDMRSQEDLPIFGWTAIGMDWKLHVAFEDKADGGAVVLGPLDSGGLGSALSFFKLFRTATMLAKWAKETYWAEFRSIVKA